MTAPRLFSLCLSGLLATAPAARAAAPDQVEFNRDIRVLLSDNCLACHGPDAGTRKARLRLDTKEGLFGETRREGPVVKPGDPAGSALWKRIVDDDPEAVMPPPDSHKQLTPEQRELFRRWIAQGAPWQGHWAFEPPRRPALPGTQAEAPADADGPIGNPIDAF
ncbi:MAG TPA: hypothetical protein PKE47_12190, partial [Verrucomicrobiota bacterium]|nr:hypothetical protein [Verrucomicrobiota bacterium]